MTKKNVELGELTTSIAELYKLITRLRNSGGYITDKTCWCIRIKNETPYADGWEFDWSVLK